MQKNYFVEIHFTGGETEEVQANNYLEIQEYIQEILDIRQSDETEIINIVIYYN